MSRPLPPDFKYDPAKLQELVNCFREMQLLLRLLSQDITLLNNWKNQFKFAFTFCKQSGELQSVVSQREHSTVEEYETMEEEHRRFCIEEAQLLQRYLESYRDTTQSLLSQLDTLPYPLQERLSDVRGNRNWVTLVVRFCTIPCSRWPSLPSRETWTINRSKHPSRPPFPERVDRLLEYAAEIDPKPSWQKLCRRMDFFVDDIIAVAWALGSPISKETDGPCDLYSWRKNGELIEEQMRSSEWRLCKCLWDHKPMLVEFCDLAEPVFGDREELVDYNKIGHLRTRANQYFRKHEIPYEVKTEKNSKARITRKTEVS